MGFCCGFLFCKVITYVQDDSLSAVSMLLPVVENYSVFDHFPNYSRNKEETSSALILEKSIDSLYQSQSEEEFVDEVSAKIKKEKTKEEGNMPGFQTEHDNAIVQSNAKENASITQLAVKAELLEIVPTTGGQVSLISSEVRNKDSPKDTEKLLSKNIENEITNIEIMKIGSIEHEEESSPNYSEGEEGEYPVIESDMINESESIKSKDQKEISIVLVEQSRDECLIKSKTYNYGTLPTMFTSKGEESIVKMAASDAVTMLKSSEQKGAADEAIRIITKAEERSLALICNAEDEAYKIRAVAEEYAGKVRGNATESPMLIRTKLKGETMAELFSIKSKSEDEASKIKAEAIIEASLIKAKAKYEASEEVFLLKFKASEELVLMANEMSKLKETADHEAFELKLKAREEAFSIKENAKYEALAIKIKAKEEASQILINASKKAMNFKISFDSRKYGPSQSSPTMESCSMTNDDTGKSVQLISNKSIKIAVKSVIGAYLRKFEVFVKHFMGILSFIPKILNDIMLLKPLNLLHEVTKLFIWTKGLILQEIYKNPVLRSLSSPLVLVAIILSIPSTAFYIQSNMSFKLWVYITWILHTI